MDIQVNTDKHVSVDEQLRDRIEHDVVAVLDQFTHPMTRVEVHLSDDSPGRTAGEHLRCVLEARPVGQDPVTVTAHGSSSGAALAGAVDKLETLLRHKFDRLADKGQRETIRHP